MKPIVFNRESIDDEYLKWCQLYPKENSEEGFVVNTGVSTKSKLFFLHRAWCSHISDTSLSSKSYVSKGKIKVCSTDLHELADWFRSKRTNFKGLFRECKTCNPWQKKRES